MHIRIIIGKLYQLFLFVYSISVGNLLSFFTKCKLYFRLTFQVYWTQVLAYDCILIFCGFHATLQLTMVEHHDLLLNLGNRYLRWIELNNFKGFVEIGPSIPFIQCIKYTTTPKAHKRTWWCHQMETFSALLAICAGNSPVPDEYPTQRPVTRSFDVFFDPRLNKQLSKQSWCWWLETISRPLWRHRNEECRF